MSSTWNLCTSLYWVRQTLWSKILALLHIAKWSNETSWSESRKVFWMCRKVIKLFRHTLDEKEGEEIPQDFKIIFDRLSSKLGANCGLRRVPSATTNTFYVTTYRFQIPLMHDVDYHNIEGKIYVDRNVTQNSDWLFYTESIFFHSNAFLHANT